jgi:hypothetical protein
MKRCEKHSLITLGLNRWKDNLPNALKNLLLLLLLQLGRPHLKKVRLTKTQLALAKKFKLTPEQYAKELLKTENANG